MRKHKRPPQGTHSIKGPGQERRIAHAAERILSGVLAFNAVHADPDWDMIARTTPDPDAWARLCETFGRVTVGEAYDFYRRGRP